MQIDIITTQEDKDKAKIKDDNLLQEMLALTYDGVPDFVQKENQNDVIVAIIRAINGGR